MAILLRQYKLARVPRLFSQHWSLLLSLCPFKGCVCHMTSSALGHPHAAGIPSNMLRFSTWAIDSLCFLLTWQHWGHDDFNYREQCAVNMAPDCTVPSSPSLVVSQIRLWKASRCFAWPCCDMATSDNASNCQDFWFCFLWELETYKDPIFLEFR